jgi:phospholipid/cholesterol/gamma-HCH transport system substrate-binding protein
MKNTLETRLGVFFALALVAAVIILELIGAVDYFKPGYRIDASFRNAQELQADDAVKMAGVEIGRVEHVDLVNGRARVTMKIDRKYPIKTDAKAGIKFTGLMGQNFVSIEGGSPEAPDALPGATLTAAEQPDLSAIMTKLDNVASGIEGFSKSFSPENLSSLIGPINDFVKQNSPNLTAMVGNLKLVSDNLVQGKGTVGKLLNDDSLYHAAYNTVTNIQSASSDLKGLFAKAEGMLGDAQGMVARVNSGQGTLGKLASDEQLYREMTQAATHLREILEKINRGQGSVGKLVNDESLIKNAKMTLQKVEKATEGLEDQGPLSVLGIAINSLF